MSSWTKNTILSFFNSLPLWGKVALPLGLFILVISIMKSLVLIVKVAAVGIIIFGLLSVYDSWKKDDVKKKKS